jgi:hypothetical protein
MENILPAKDLPVINSGERNVVNETVFGKGWVATLRHYLDYPP